MKRCQVKNFYLKDKAILLSGYDILADTIYIQADQIILTDCIFECRTFTLIAKDIRIENVSANIRDIEIKTVSLKASNNDFDFNTVTYNGRRKVLNIHRNSPQKQI